MRFAFFPLTPLTGNLSRELPLAAALALQGDEVFVVQCDGVSRCFLQTTLVADVDQERLCHDCLALTGSFYDACAIPGVNRLVLSGLIDPARQQAAHAQIDALPDDALLTCVHADMPVGQWIKASLRIEYNGEHWHRLPGLFDKARAWLKAVIDAHYATEAFIGRHAPDAIVLLNGIPAIERAVWETAKRMGVRVIVYEGGPIPDSISMQEARPAASYEFPEAWAQWADVPLSAAESRQLDQFLHRRRYQGQKQDFVYSPTATDDLPEVRRRLGLPPGRPVFVAFTNVNADTSVFAAQEAYESQFDWLLDCVAFAAAHPELTLVIRVHPAEMDFVARRDGGGVPCREPVIQELLSRCEVIPPNVRLIQADDRISSYDLMRLASVVLVYVTSVGMEAAADGLPVISAGRSHYAPHGFTWHARSRSEFQDLLARLLRQPEPPTDSLERVRRYLYFWYFRCSPVLPVIKAALALRQYVDEPERYLAGLKSLTTLAQQDQPVQDRVVRYLRGLGLFVERPPAWRLRDGSDGLISLPLARNMVVLPDWAQLDEFCRTLLRQLTRLPVPVSLVVLVPGLEGDPYRFVEALAKVSAPETWPEIDFLPEGLDPASLGRVLLVTSFLVAPSPVTNGRVQQAAGELGVPTVVADDLALPTALAALTGAGAC